MNPGRIRSLRRRVERLRLRSGNVRARELASLAEAIGRSPDKRGKEPTFVMKPRPPLTIPHHKRVSKYTVASILDQLEEDLDYIEEATNG